MDSVSPEQFMSLCGAVISLIGRFVPSTYWKQEEPVQNIINHNYYNNYYNITVNQYPPAYKEVKLIEEDRDKES